MASQPTLEVYQLSTLAELSSIRLRWNELAGDVPMRSWQWLERWWHEYGNLNRSLPVGGYDLPSNVVERELYILAAFNPPDELVAIAPWYIEHTATRGRTLRFLGTGEVCTDYSTILCQAGFESAVAETLARTLSDPLHVADWLTQNSVRHWDRIEFASVPRNDRIMQQLFLALEAENNLVHRRAAESCWRVNLPTSWDDYLASLSKSHRKQVRRRQKEFFDSGRAQVRWVENEEQLADAWKLLARLHQLRQKSRGNAGCFASSNYTRFHQQTTRELLAAGNLWMAVLELDSTPVAVDYSFVGGTSVYAYQGGISPVALQFGPGQLLTMAALQRAIAEGYRSFDFLRGDEAYKAHWRAASQPMDDIRIVKHTATNRVRHSLWMAGDHVRGWLKTGLNAGLAR
jgi:CelD/BcsL family acetyltransferase involved in cellulose biosynthesis